MSDHLLHIDGIYEGNPSWSLTCEHAMGASAWRYRNPDGSFTGNPDECWLRSWWDDLGGELVDINVAITTLPIPVRPGLDWDYEDGGSITLDPPESCVVASVRGGVEAVAVVPATATANPPKDTA